MPPSFSEGFPPAVVGLTESIIRSYPTHRQNLERVLGRLRDDELALLDSYVQFCQTRGVDISALSDSYLTVVEDTLDQQRYFQKHGRYKHSSFEEVASGVYHNPDYMGRYMQGLALTTFLWPNHLEIHRFFLRTLPKDHSGHYLEIGPGHGYHFLWALRLCRYEKFVGIDLSDTSIDLTTAIVEHFLPTTESRWRLKKADFLSCDIPRGKYRAVVMGEVLEHVEHPQAFMKRIYEVAHPEAYIYISTCVNAPAIDHIYLFSNTDEVESLLRGCGFEIREKLMLPH